MRKRLLPCCGLAILLAASCKSSSEDTNAKNADTGPFGDGVAVNELVHLDNLSGPVDVVRDEHGTVHIFATNLADAVRVEAYQMGRDRTAQLELFRRVAEGRTAELLGDVSPDLIDNDITARTIGLKRAAELIYATYPEGSEPKAVLDAFADGVSQFNARLQSGDEILPRQAVGLSKSAFEPWTAVDVLAVARLETQELSYSADEDIAMQALMDATRAAFDAKSLDPLAQKRTAFLVDFSRFAPLDPTTPMTGFPNDGALSQRIVPPREPPRMQPSVHLAAGLAASTRGWAAATKRIQAVLGKKPFRGSNNWAIAPSLSASGHAMLASDPHLALQAPSVLYGVHLEVSDPDASKQVHASGMAFPGIPGLVLGFNANVAWGATTADYDVSDVYQETLTSDGSAVVFKGAHVPLEKVHETIRVAGGDPVEYDVLVVPHHGPIVPTIVDHKVVAPDPAKGALSIKWLGMQATDELGAFTGFMRASTIDDARAALRHMGVGAQNFVFADTKGSVFWSTQSMIPKRDKRAFTWDPKTFTGTIPCSVLPGDGSAEWTGQYLEEAYVPHLANPPRGYIATANGDQIGDLLDNDPTNDTAPSGEPVYLSCWHDAGYRVGRITKRLTDATSAGQKLSLDDFASIQADVRSNVGAALTPGLLSALASAEEERNTPGKYADLSSVVASDRYKAAQIPALIDMLTRWDKEAGYDARAGVSLDDGSNSADAVEANASKATLVFNAWVVRMIELTYGDELAKIGIFDPGVEMRRALVYLLTADPKTLATYDAASGDSAIFDDMSTTAIESRRERMVTSLLDALDYLDKKLGADRDAWRWGKVHTLRMEALISLWGSMSIPPAGDTVFPNGFPRHGDGYNVDVGSYYDRPASLDAVDFTYSEGPVQRFVIDVSPDGPAARNVTPGGAVWDPASPHFRDEADLYRKNLNHPVPYARADIIAAAESHVVFTPAAIGGASRDVP